MYIRGSAAEQVKERKESVNWEKGQIYSPNQRSKRTNQKIKKENSEDSLMHLQDNLRH